MRNKEQENRGMKDSRVPPVKGAVTDLQDLVQRPAAIFGHGHPAEFIQMDNPSVFELPQ